MQSNPTDIPCSAFMRKEEAAPAWDWVATSSDVLILFDQVASLPQGQVQRTITFVLDKGRLSQPEGAQAETTLNSGWSLWWHDGSRWHWRVIGAETLQEMSDDFRAVLDFGPKEIRIVPPGQKIPHYLN